MPEGFRYDVFLSHSGKDKAAVCPPPERLDDAPIKGFLTRIRHL